jgi:hypothetical protein
MTITQLEIRFKTKVSHKHMFVIYHRNTPLPKVRKGLDPYRRNKLFFPKQLNTIMRLGIN